VCTEIHTKLTLDILILLKAILDGILKTTKDNVGKDKVKGDKM
jgi:hypothetical protein